MRQTACARRSLTGMIGGGTLGREPHVRHEASGVHLAARRRGRLCVAKARGARAQQPAMPAVGFLRGGSLTDVPVDRVTAFHQGLKEAGFVEGQNVAIEYRSDEYQTDRLRLLVADLLHGQVAVIVGDTPAALAAKAVTTTVPIVFVTGVTRLGLASSPASTGRSATLPV